MIGRPHRSPAAPAWKSYNLSEAVRRAPPLRILSGPTSEPANRRARMEAAITIDERFERIERVTAGLAEERRKDREEFRSLWRDTQRQLNDLTGKVADLG